MAYEISEGAVAGALYIPLTELNKANGGATFWDNKKNIRDAMKKIHSGLKKTSPSGAERTAYMEWMDPTNGFGKTINGKSWDARVTAAMHGYSGAIAAKEWMQSHKESVNLSAKDQIYLTGGSWDAKIEWLKINHKGWDDYNSADLVVTRGKCFYGISLKKKDTPTSADPPMINKSIMELLKTFDKNIKVKKIIDELKDAKAKYFGDVIIKAVKSGPLKGTTGIGNAEDEFYTSIRHPKKSKGWISLIDLKGPAAFKFGNTNQRQKKDDDTGEIIESYQYYVTDVNKNKIICEDQPPSAKEEQALLSNDVVQKAFGIGPYQNESNWKMRKYVNGSLGNPNKFYKTILKILDDPKVVEDIADVLLDSILKVSLTSGIEKVKDGCANCHFAFALITAAAKYDKGKYRSFTKANVKENPVIQSVLSALHKENKKTTWIIKEAMSEKKGETLLEFKRSEAEKKGKEPPAKLFFTIGIEGKSKFHNILFLEIRYKGTFSPWPQFLGGMSDEFMSKIKSQAGIYEFTGDCGSK